MKIKLLLFLFILLNSAAAFCGDIEINLPNTATQPIISSTKAVIASGINSNDVIDLTNRMLEHNFSEEDQLEVHQILINSQKENIPIEPIINKANEGIAKKIASKNIIQAIKKVQNRHVFASKQAKIITEDKNEADFLSNTIVEGLSAGINDNDINKTVQVLRQKTKHLNKAQVKELSIETFQTTKFMARLGVGSPDATEIVCEGLKQGYSARDFNKLRSFFQIEVQRGNPSVIAEKYRKRIKKGIYPEQISSENNNENANNPLFRRNKNDNDGCEQTFKKPLPKPGFD